MRRLTTTEKNKLLDHMEMNGDTTIAIGTNIIVDGKVVAVTVPDTSELEDGTYTLQCTLVEGVPTFEWIASA